MANITLNIHDNEQDNTSKASGSKQGSKSQPKPVKSDSVTKEAPKDGKVSS